MKNFPFWRGAFYSAKTAAVLKSVGEDLSQFQAQSGLFGDEEAMLTAAQVATLRKQYAVKMKKLVAERI